MKIINRKDIYEDWHKAFNNTNIILPTYVFVNSLLAPMIFDLFIYENEDVWVQFDPDETDKQKCVIETTYGGIIYRKFNPFTDNEITCYFEEYVSLEKQSLKDMKIVFKEIEDEESFEPWWAPAGIQPGNRK